MNVAGIKAINDQHRKQKEQLKQEIASLKAEIDEALGIARWCDSTNNHGRDSVVDLVKNLLHLHNVLVDDTIEQDRRTTYLNAEVERLKAEIERLSTDAVTGIAGRGVFDRAMVTSFARSRRSRHPQKPMGVLMIDVDQFKRVNDEFGHSIGDKILHLVAQTLKDHTRGTDTLARYGGEEFAVVVDDADPRGLDALASIMRREVDAVNLPGYPVVTVSIGWSIQLPYDESAIDILKRADTAMYAAKSNGRNCVERR